MGAMAAGKKPGLYFFCMNDLYRTTLAFFWSDMFFVAVPLYALNFSFPGPARISVLPAIFKNKIYGKSSDTFSYTLHLKVLKI